MRTTRLTLWLVAAASLLLIAPSRAAQTAWLKSRAQAVETARNSGKLILLLAGRESCGNCQYMRNTVCESAGVKPQLTGNFVCWFCPVDDSTEWYAYASGLGGFTLPLMCVIEPGNSMSYLDRTTGIQSPSTFGDRLNSRLPTQPIALNLTRTTTSRLHWVSEPSCQYRVLRSTDLTHWTLVGGVVAGSGSGVEFADSSAGAYGVYRVMGFRPVPAGRSP